MLGSPPFSTKPPPKKRGEPPYIPKEQLTKTKGGS